MAINILALDPSNVYLNNNEKSELENITTFPWTGFNKKSIGYVNLNVDVDLQESCPPKIVKIDIDAVELDKQRKKAAEEYKAAYNKWESYPENDGTTKQELFQEMQKKDAILGKLNNMKPGQNYCDIAILGQYYKAPASSPMSKDKVVLYTDTIGDNLDVLIMTYVHEMMHAYYATAYPVEKVEEPIVEYSTLCFLYDYDKANGTSYFKSAYKDIKDKQYLFGAVHYGFGAYLFDNKNSYWNWMKLYKKLKTVLHTSKPNIDTYENLFAGLYPFDKEYDAMELLYHLLTNSSSTPASMSKVSKSYSTGSTSLEGILAILKAKPTILLNKNTINNYCTWLRAIQKELDKETPPIGIINDWIYNKKGIKNNRLNVDKFFITKFNPTGAPVVGLKVGKHDYSNCLAALHWLYDSI